MTELPLPSGERVGERGLAGDAGAVGETVRFANPTVLVEAGYDQATPPLPTLSPWGRGLFGQSTTTKVSPSTRR